MTSSNEIYIKKGNLDITLMDKTDIESRLNQKVNIQDFNELKNYLTTLINGIGED